MKQSKYLGYQDGNWECTHVGVAGVQSAFAKKKAPNGRAIRCVSAGHRQYYYVFERITSDHKALKMIRLSAAQMLAVRKGEKTVEHYAKKKEAKRSREFTKKVSYSFCD
jgi:hypothetical protein